MAISGDLRVSATLPLHHSYPRRTSLQSPKVDFYCSLNGASSIFEFGPKFPSMAIKRLNIRGQCKPVSGVGGDRELSPKFFSQEAENFLLDAVNMSFFERLNLAWKIIFPSVSRKSSNASIAKQRLKMILFSDRCEVSDEAKRQIVNNIVRALSDFVVIESQDKVQLSVSADTDLGTIYSVTVPVRRVKPGYQNMDEYGTITNIEYKDVGDSSGSVDVKFDFFVPDENS
ncbi:cell division topological specificity factor-like protein, chloroplastic-like [Senna tora]|uniref:Cell division topological specificity factor-like protein, chloroplastic-like n=1 Tax=Senna tora TaxID=362788 RepID=A0A834W9M4_9FABA|nr:cell division topological specificity factor-like protein, chloroplastic-like [Senna tora]